MARFHFNVSFYAFSLFFLNALATPAKLESKSLPSLVIAIKPDKNPDAMVTERKSLESVLSKLLSQPVRVIVPLSSAVILEGLSNGSIDLAFLGSLDMILAKRQKIARTLLAVEIDGRNSYESYWVSLKDKPYKSIADLKGKPIAFASHTSTSGRLIPEAALIKRGFIKQGESPEVFFHKGNVWYGTGYVSAIERVLQGQAEAAAVSDYVMLKDKHLTNEQRARLKVIDRQGPVPTHVIAIRSKIDDKQMQSIKRALLKLNDEPHRTLRDKVFTSSLTEVQEDQHLKSTEEAMQLTDLK